MKLKTFGILCIIFCFLVAAAFYALKKDPFEHQGRMGERLFADLPANAITRIQLIGPTREVRLKKGASVWEVENRYDYPADFDKIADMIKKIRDLKVGRTFTADSGVKQRLALLDPQASGKVEDDQKGTRVILFSDGDAPPVLDLLIGKAREGDGVSGGHHIMRMGAAHDETVYLVDQSFRFLSTDPDDWLDKSLVDVAPEEVRQVTCYDAVSGDLLYRLTRSAKGKAPDLEGISEDESAEPSKIERVFGALSGLTIDGVAGHRGVVDFAGLFNPRRFEYRLFDGSLYTLETGKQGGDGGDRNYLTIATGYEQPPQTDGGENASDEGTGIKGSAETDMPAVNEKMQQLNERFQPWTFTISTWKYEGLIYDRKALLKQKS